ncbi:MAG: hypothetical protein Q7R45_15630 [Sulfuricaulis sp.]|nr:hypothetical protein [Sulfuricaulis sp.]
MSCDVCLVMDFDGPCEFYKSSKSRARKEYRCCECNGVIAKGDTYERATGKFDGILFAEKTCLLCTEIRDVFTCGGGFVHTRLWEAMEEEAFPRLTTASTCFRELGAAAKQVVLDRWREWKGLVAS